jgi:uncharacterized protein (DUF302 family)
MNQENCTSRAINVEHVRITSRRPFAVVRAAIEANVPKLDTHIAAALREGDAERAREYDEQGPALSIFEQRDHGSLLEIAGHRRNAIQYDIGNPLTASKMTRYALGAALYAPLRVVLYEDQNGNGVFEYDRPSSFFKQFSDERVTEVSLHLDSALESALCHAAG